MSYFLTLAFILFVYMNLWFVVSLIKKRNDVADIAWGLGFVVLSWVSLFLSDNFSQQSLIASTLVTIWGVRLAWHIFSRNRGKSEDYRYQDWREQWGKWFYLRSYAQVFMLQGFILFFVVLPVLILHTAPHTPLGILDVIGILVWIVGFNFESISDAQLSIFKKDPSNKGKLIQTGLWKYSRHPNYFGEVTQWWGIWLIALSVPYGWLGIIGPLTITTLILKVSGVPLLEKKMEKNPDFPEYKRKTSMFIPLPPRT